MKELKLTYLNNDEHTHLDARHSTTDILDMAFVTLSLMSRHIRFRVGESLGGDHLPIEIFLDRPLQRNIPITSARYQFAKADINTFQNKMAEIFNSNLFNHLPQKASDMDEYQKHLVDSMKEAADTSIPKVDCCEKADKIKVNKDTLKLIEEKRKLRRQYAKQTPPSTKSSINKLQKEINQKLNKETSTRWEKFCNSISLEPREVLPY